MKKLILTAFGLVVGATLVHAQGYIIFTGNSAAITTNSTAAYGGGSQTGTSGRTLQGAGAFDYQLLFATSTTAGDASPLGPDWILATQNGGAALIGNNFVGNPGGLTGPGTSSGVQVSMASGTTYDVMLVGWSSGLGANWAAVSALLSGGFASQSNPNLFFGNTPIGTATPFSAAGGGDPSVFPSMFANSSLVLYSAVPTPEPATLALAGLGGLSMLFLRRRKA